MERVLTPTNCLPNTYFYMSFNHVNHFSLAVLKVLFRRAAQPGLTRSTKVQMTLKVVASAVLYENELMINAALCDRQKRTCVCMMPGYAMSHQSLHSSSSMDSPMTQSGIYGVDMSGRQLFSHQVMHTYDDTVAVKLSLYSQHFPGISSQSSRCSAYQKWPTWHSHSLPDSVQARRTSYPFKV